MTAARIDKLDTVCSLSPNLQWFTHRRHSSTLRLQGRACSHNGHNRLGPRRSSGAGVADAVVLHRRCEQGNRRRSVVVAHMFPTVLLLIFISSLLWRRCPRPTSTA